MTRTSCLRRRRWCGVKVQQRYLGVEEVEEGEADEVEEAEVDRRCWMLHQPGSVWC